MKDFKLKPCPLCGKGFRKNLINAYEHDNEECILHGLEISNEKLLKQWNTRKPMERIVERLQDELELSGKEKERTIKENPLQFNRVVGYSNGIAVAIDIVREEGVVDV